MSDSEFHDRQKANGAVLTAEVADSIRTIEFGPDGFPVVPSFEPLGPPTEAVHYGSAHKEYMRAKSSAVVFDMSHRGHLEITGADRQKFLNGFCTADIMALKPGTGVETFLPDIKGKILGYGFVFAGENSLLLETVSCSVEPLSKHLQKYAITEDVEFLDRGKQLGELYFSGPKAVEKLGELAGDVSSLGVLEHRPATIGEIDLTIRRVDWLGSPGFLLCMPRESLSAVWQSILDADIRPAGVAAFHALRILAGFPLYGIDISDENLAQEASRTEQAINFKKGCYLGQEPIARIDSMGHVNRELRTIKLDSTAVPAPGAKITDSAGKDIGRVTSYAMLPDEHVLVAFAYVHRNFLKPGTEVLVDCDEEAIPAKVL